MIYELISSILNTGTPNPDPDDELKVRARKYVLREACNKYMQTGDPTFTLDEIKARLRGLGPEYAVIQTNENWAGSGFVDIDENDKYYLNEEGKSACKRGEFDR
jgi:hypothetical protein